MPKPLNVAFVAGTTGPWRIDSITPYVGESLPPAARLAMLEGGPQTLVPTSAWTLRGHTSNRRYTTRLEADALTSTQEGLGRTQATCAALIPIRKTEAWWDLAQDERRAIFEDQSRHTDLGLRYLPAISRRLHHGRELGEPFDFLTWFEYAPEHSDMFEDLVARLRETAEWAFVDREVDIRLTRLAPDQTLR